MGTTAAVANAAGAGAGAGVAATTSMFVTVGVGIGGSLIAVLLVFLLGYLNVLEGVSEESHRLRRMLVATTVPLAITFAAVIALASMQAW
jgi:Na+-driven multidrug efflux pump